jgi:hypothetical protein
MSYAAPTLAGFISFVQTFLAPPAPFDPTTDGTMDFAFQVSCQIVYQGLQLVTSPIGPVNPDWQLYSLAVYNLGTDTLINYVQDGPNAPVYKDDMPYWQWLRSKYGINDFQPGLVTSSADQGTSVGFQVLPQIASMTMANLQQLKTPFGRRYLAFAGQWGPLWGLTP